MMFLFTQLYFKLISKTIAVRRLQPGAIVVFGDGVKLTVEEARFGDNLRTFKKKLAREVIITFTNGRVLKAHPGEPVSVLRR